MTLITGKKLGPYEIKASLGAGGMGEVYEAKDTRLDRNVAVKVLRETFADDPERLERFQREARAVSKLNHAHICTLHDVGEHEGIHYLVLERLEGETLADRMKRGPLPMDAALEIADQVVDALDAAHGAGVVHRDLKPGNVMLTKSGVKLLDFGLATQVGEEQESVSDLSSAPTAAKPLTSAGAILGTLQYMAPEQLEGKDVDTRADLFAFGAVLYEMLTGRRAFEAKSQASLISAIMSSEPRPVSDFQSTSPPALDDVVRRCLAKEPDARWQTARDLRYALAWSRRLPTGADGSRTPSSAPRWAALALAGGALLAAIGLLSRFGSGDPGATSLSAQRFVVDLPPGQSFPEFGLATPLALSPDGARLAYVAEEAGVTRLYLREHDAFEAREIEGTEGVEAVAFSPNGQWIAFHANGRLKKVLAEGGVPIALCDAPRLRYLTWGKGKSESLVFLASQPAVLMRVSADGGTPERLPTSDTIGHVSPAFLPDGDHLIYGVGPDVIADVVNVLSLSTGESRELFRSAVGVRALQFVANGSQSSGHLVYIEGDALVALPFDAATLEIKGAPSSVAFQIHQSLDSNTFFATSATGALAYVPGDSAVDVVWVDRTGTAEPLPIERGHFDHPRLSPDGTRVLLHSPPYQNAWVYNLTRGGRIAIGRGEGVRDGVLHSVWSSDGSQVVYRSAQQILVQASDGTGDPKLLWTSESPIPSPISWGANDVIAFENRTTSGWDIALLDVPSGEVTSFLATPAFEASPVFSPDGRWLAYVSDEGGRREVYVRDYTSEGQRYPVSVGGGTEPRWSPDGREIFYRNGRSMLAVSVETGPALELNLGPPRELFAGSFVADLNGHPQYAVAPDGEHFLMLRNSPRPVIRMVLDWAKELQELAPAQ